MPSNLLCHKSLSLTLRFKIGVVILKVCDFWELLPVKSYSFCVLLVDSDLLFAPKIKVFQYSRSCPIVMSLHLSLLVDSDIF